MKDEIILLTMFTAVKVQTKVIAIIDEVINVSRSVEKYRVRCLRTFEFSYALQGRRNSL